MELQAASAFLLAIVCMCQRSMPPMGFTCREITVITFIVNTPPLEGLNEYVNFCDLHKRTVCDTAGIVLGVSDFKINHYHTLKIVILAHQTFCIFVYVKIFTTSGVDKYRKLIIVDIVCLTPDVLRVQK